VVHGLVPRAHPVLSETKVTDSGSNLAAAATLAAAPADADATAPPVASPATTIVAANPALIILDIDRHELFVLITTRIRCEYEPIADPGWPDLPIRPRNHAAAEPSGQRFEPTGPEDEGQRNAETGRGAD
jgi:hypothetical protein